MKIYFIYFFLIISLQINAQGFICAVGGGSEDYGSWSDTPYNWIVQKADSGKIFVLSYSDQTNWIPDYFVSLGAASAENIKISSRSIADQQSTYDKLITSKAIFIKGGDQYKYVNYWKGTKTEDAIRFIYENGGVISGTSAGAMILGDLVFTAKNGTAYSRNSLINPFDSKITLENDFLNLGEDLIFDTHFIERGRFGRLIAFIFNSYVNYGEKYIGIGIDDRTAICIDNNQIGYVFGSGSVSIFQQDERTKLSGSSSNYSVENLKYDQLLHGWEYDFKNNKITGYPNSVIQLDTNRIIKLPRTNIYLSGSNNILNNINNGLETYLKDIDSDLVGIITTVNYLENVLDLTNNFDMNNINDNLIFLPQMKMKLLTN